jgi:cyclopropane-fatty-acyl-phospholipid synthase
MNRMSTRSPSTTLIPGKASDLVLKRSPLLLRPLLKRLTDARVSAISLILPNGQRFTVGHAQSDVQIPLVRLHRRRVVVKSAFSGMMGWAESFMDGDWSCDNLVALTDWAMHNESALKEAFQEQSLARLLINLWHKKRDNTREGSRKNIAYHYDLGNAFYKRWLDETMTYSSAYFAGQSRTLKEAQEAKYQRILELSETQPGDRILEIGCGWGGFAETVARHDEHTQLYGVTLSKEQLEYAKARISSLEADQRVTLSYQDYRDVQTTFDRIVSIEMFEAVGEPHWRTYFETLNRSLNEGGTAVLQVICIAPERFDYYRSHADFIQRYIFPGGMLPTAQIMHQLAAQHGFEVEVDEEFGLDYAETLRQWREQFMADWESIHPMGYDERFKRMWEYYLCYCESGFRYGSIDVRFFKLRKTA